ncbi:MAG: hypothetical protein J1F01_02095 [Oscillospiraceae bacterium]|nr:hypothetical protein [Oscillospiraceae bacterium]
MLDKFIKRILVAAIESFPVNESKKKKLLLNIIDKKNIEGVNSDVL